MSLNLMNSLHFILVDFIKRRNQLNIFVSSRAHIEFAFKNFSHFPCEIAHFT